MSKSIIIGRHEYNVEGTLPIVDGSTIKTKSGLKAVIVQLLSSVGYTFSHPVRVPPAFLLNYRLVDRKILVKCLKNLVHQLEDFPVRVLDLCVLGSDGLSVVCPFTGKHDRICKLTMSCDLPTRHSEVINYVPLSEVPSFVETFFSSPYSINHKIIIQ